MLWLPMKGMVQQPIETAYNSCKIKDVILLQPQHQLAKSSMLLVRDI